MLLRITLIVVFFLSAILAPWWCTALIAVILAAKGNDLFVLPIGGVCVDILFGTPIASLGGFSFVYTTVFSILALVAFFIHRHIFE